uniref:Reverse transcriptase domain-containing protein n=1 Tax=Strongyloides papillosus TaxID=174720 RepID=A0A0N5BDD4_STREA
MGKIKKRSETRLPVKSCSLYYWFGGIKRLIDSKLNNKFAIWGHQYNMICYADDTAIISNDATSFKENIQLLVNYSKTFGLLINNKKSFIMASDSSFKCKNIEMVETFTYLGKPISLKIIRPFTHIATSKAWRAYHKYKSFARLGNLDVKKYIFNSIIRPTMLYSCQTWTINKTVVNSLAKTERSILRRIFNIRLWNKLDNSYSHNRDLYKMLNIKPMDEYVIDIQLKYIGHQLRKRNSLEKTILLCYFKDKRKTGRPRQRLMDNLFKKLGVRNTYHTEQDRSTWKTIPQLFYYNNYLLLTIFLHV